MRIHLSFDRKFVTGSGHRKWTSLGMRHESCGMINIIPQRNHYHHKIQWLIFIKCISCHHGIISLSQTLFQRKPFPRKNLLRHFSNEMKNYSGSVIRYENSSPWRPRKLTKIWILFDFGQFFSHRTILSKKQVLNSSVIFRDFLKNSL